MKHCSELYIKKNGNNGSYLFFLCGPVLVHGLGNVDLIDN